MQRSIFDSRMHLNRGREALRGYNEKDDQHSWSSFYGAGDEARTRYLHLGKVALYRMSYTRIRQMQV